MTSAVSATLGPESVLAALCGRDVLSATAAVTDDESGLWPEERALVERAVARRRHQFAAARRCARALLGRLGEPARPLLRTPGGAPAWPEGVLGSISHTDELVAVVVARRGAIAGLGVDVEPDAPLEAALWRGICTPAEIERLPSGDESARGRAVHLAFSAKESLYKCVHPHARRFIRFDEVEVELRQDGRFAASLPADVRAALPGGARLEGSFARHAGWIVALATLRGGGPTG
jgi:4'-phosphopantetheinyl transferase EntD